MWVILRRLNFPSAARGLGAVAGDPLASFRLP